ncbi:MAG: hypothetical protein HYV07_07505 [Deltaproteobacteria bacterium]|nr:hypothetical protein [Deltaproteobacteria bacterium]
MARKDDPSSDRLGRIERVLEETVELSHRTQKQIDALASEHRSLAAETHDFMAETRQMNRSLLALIRQGQTRMAKLETRSSRTLKRRSSG